MVFRIRNTTKPSLKTSLNLVTTDNSDDMMVMVMRVVLPVVITLLIAIAAINY